MRKVFFDTSAYNSLLKENKCCFDIIYKAKCDKTIEVFWHPSIIVELLCTFKKHPSVGKELISIFFKLANPLGLHQPSNLIAADFQVLVDPHAKDSIYIDFAYIDQLFETKDLIKNLSQGIVHNKNDLFRLIEEKIQQKRTDYLSFERVVNNSLNKDILLKKFVRDYKHLALSESQAIMLTRKKLNSMPHLATALKLTKILKAFKDGKYKKGKNDFEDMCFLICLPGMDMFVTDDTKKDSPRKIGFNEMYEMVFKKKSYTINEFTKKLSEIRK